MNDGYLVLARDRKISASGGVVLSGLSCSFFSSYQKVSQMWISFDETAGDANDWETHLLHFSA